MEDGARKLLGVMADEGVDRLLEHLRAGARSEAQLRRALGLSHRTAHQRLAELEALGVVFSRPGRPQGRGRPGRRWHLKHAELVARFAEQAEAVAAQLRDRSSGKE